MMLFITSFSGCQKKDSDDSGMLYISIRHSVKDNNIHHFDWYVENRSLKKDDVLTFENGNIMNYEIMNTHNGTKYTKENEDNSTVILKKGEQFHTAIDLKLTEKGHYCASFWASAEEPNQGRMTIYFDIE